jgi:membrane protein implicated in regulation of membrane protease activity
MRPKSPKGTASAAAAAAPSSLPTVPVDLEQLQSSGIEDLPGQAITDARKRRWWIAGGGVAAVGLPTGPGLYWALSGHPVAALIVAAVAIVTGILSTVAVMYQARQVAVAAMYQAQEATRRKEIECRSSEALANALGRVMDDAHARPLDSSVREAWEVERLRASSRQFTSDVAPLLTALLQRRPRMGA